ncbi:hypothetical protein Cob_v009489 [Colletotrichum orbiculare MAFF 240422]|uniref:Cyanovirin-N domain-containing protein n=1 Tax=Colletotrichum orbiculare (strain 104-T / ATCC 96160 / CBS 514.97 / LARS 414 / MAFF 240422) TaxID=1213857 RepID=A0A484FJ79_COLOR|nr:hypothetical protein Cob_v009489 [Colletotrichum orbiculare MAFF 240422]
MKPIQLTLAALFAPGVLAEDVWNRGSTTTARVPAPPRQSCSPVNLNDCFVNDRGTLRAQHGQTGRLELPAFSTPKSCEDCSHASSGGVLTCQCHDGEGGPAETSTNVDTAIKPIGASRIGYFGVRPWTSCDP